MSLNKKLRTCIITFILLVSSFSIFIISPENVKADDMDLFGSEDELIASGFHPFVSSGMYIYEGNETIKINGDIEFNLFFTNTLLTQTIFKDDIKIAINKIGVDFSTELFKLEEIASKTITFTPKLFGDSIQNFPITLENASFEINEGDWLLFTVQTIHSGKPIGNIVEKRFERNLIENIKKIANLLNNSVSEENQESFEILMAFLDEFEELGITGEEAASLVNSFRSTSLVFNSADYPSSVFLPVESNDNLTLYFESADTGGEGFGIYMGNTTPNGSAFTWPPRFIEDGSFNQNWLLWATICWLQYVLIGEPTEEEDQNIITFYLDNENKLTTEEPTSSSTARFKFEKNEPKKWEGAIFSRNKIIKNVTADLYMYYSKIMLLRKITINVTLFDETTGKAISTVETQLDRTKILELILRRPNSPTEIVFSDFAEKELWYNHNYSLIISYSVGPLGPFSPLRKTHLLCNSESYPSSITFNLEETENIKITNELEDQKIIPGGSAEFDLVIESKYSDTVNIDVAPEDPDEDLEQWSIEIDPESVKINEGEKETVKVIVTSLDDSIDAYEQDDLDLIFTVTGNTGYDSKEAEVEISEDAAEYDIIVDVPRRKEIKHGTSETYVFKIKNGNTGFMEDIYDITASSEHDWPVEVDYDESYIKVGEELSVSVKISVPAYTDISSDKLTLTITSITSEEHGKDLTKVVSVNTKVITPNILESIYRVFETTARSIGLDDVLGGYAAAFLIFIVLFIIIIFLIVILYILRIKYVEIVCLERIKEIGPDEKAEFNLEVHNPYKRKLTYELSTKVNSDPDNWEISIDTENAILESKEKQAVKLTVEPTDFVKQDDWVEVKLIAKPIEKKKVAEISIVTSIKDAKPDLRILGVLHWPKVFKTGERIVTSFRIHNRGNVSSGKVSVILYVNGEEKNKVEDITIPRGAYAEIEIPWIAVKGKNEVNIVVK